MFGNPFFTLLVGNTIVFFSLALKRIIFHKNIVWSPCHELQLLSRFIQHRHKHFWIIFKKIWKEDEIKLLLFSKLCFAVSFRLVSVKMLLPLIFRDSTHFQGIPIAILLLVGWNYKILPKLRNIVDFLEIGSFPKKEKYPQKQEKNWLFWNMFFWGQLKLQNSPTDWLKIKI